MKPASFDYYAPRTLDEALSLLAQHGSDAKPLAGGQSLIPAMNFRLAAPSVLIDLNPIETLAYVTENDGGLRIGAMTRHCSVERSAVVSQVAPLISAAMPFVAHLAIRTRGTIGGSLAHADPAAELPAVMLALDAAMTLTSSRGARRVPAGEFFTGLFTTALEAGELLTEIEVPRLPPRSGVAFQEFSRRHGDFALAGAAAMVTCDEAGRCTTARLALLSVGERPVMPAAVARTLQGQAPTGEAIRAASTALAAELDPPGDIHASSRYRRHLATVLSRRVLERAFQAAANVREPA
jgi:aerobic carbon-monoxide dehydrogenase medium subunit